MMDNLWAEFLEYLNSEDARVQIFAWILTSVILTGALSLAVFASRKIIKAYIEHLQQSRLMKPFVGSFFLYNGPTAAGFGDAPRLTRLTVKRSFLGGSTVRQESVSPRALMYKGHAKATETLLRAVLHARDGDIKYICLLSFFATQASSARVTIGVMSAVNQNGEPWRVSAILSSELFHSDDVGVLLKLVDQPIATRELRRSVQSAAEAASAKTLSEYGIFEHPLSGQEQVTRVSVLRKNQKPSK